MKAQPHRVVVAVSELMRQQTLAAYPHLPTDMPVILPGVDAPNNSLTQAQARAQLGLPLDKKMILFVGNDYARKGLPALLASLPLLQADVHVACVGAAATIPKFQLMAAELGVSERVHFVGALADISLAYRAADLLVHPTLEDSFAMVVLEAVSYGLPVVVSSERYCGISAFLQNEQNALIMCDPRDSMTMMSAINRILNDDGLRQTLSHGGVIFAAGYQWHKAVSAYAQLFEEIYT